MQRSLHWRSRHAGEHAQHADLPIDFCPQTVSQPFQSMFSRRVLTRTRNRAHSRVGVDENDLSTAGFQHRQKRLSEQVRRPYVNVELSIEVVHRCLLKRSQINHAGAVLEFVRLSAVSDQIRGKIVDLLADIEIDRINQSSRRFTQAPRNLSERIRAPAEQAKRCSPSGQLFGDRSADAAARSSHYRGSAGKTFVRARARLEFALLECCRAHQAFSHSNAWCSNSWAAFATNAKGKPERSAISIRLFSPSERLSTQSSASSRLRPSLAPPMLP